METEQIRKQRDDIEYEISNLEYEIFKKFRVEPENSKLKRIFQIAKEMNNQFMYAKLEQIDLLEINKRLRNEKP
jgi:hypothetical protein